ncbi:endonuclease/exonuclease/phosphatase family protein [Gammaproteobacteria bacterium]|nr:endonuclease/exonuclease/phosphatase family protein [Gammaproteobacteria bacterium]
MKIISWNCNLKFAKKFEAIEGFKPDICFIQECEDLPIDFFPGYQYFWTGRNDKKGLGILTKDKTASVNKNHNSKLINFLPVNSHGMNLLGVWAYNHRAARFGSGFNGNTIDAIGFYRSWLKESDQALVAGDFNNSVIWDKPNNRNNFVEINSELNKIGLKSAYHNLTGEVFGEEAKGTLFHTKKESKKYHIDYIYTKAPDCEKLDIGLYADWIKLSDHVPLFVNLK